MFARQVPVPPDALAIAGALKADGGERVFCLDHRFAGGAQGGAEPWATRVSFVGADPHDTVSVIDPARAGAGLGDAGASAWADAFPEWVGVMPYEALRGRERPGWSRREGRPAPRVARAEWSRYGAVCAVDHDSGRVFALGLDEADVARLAARLVRLAARGALAVEVARELELELADRAGDGDARHEERVRAALELVRAGDLYQVNLARAFELALVKGTPFGLYRALARASRPAFGAYLELGDGASVVSASPELLLRAEAPRPAADSPEGSRAFGAIWTLPIKGTRPRGADARADADLAHDLECDPKERAELAMIVDVERNDLGRVAETGSVRVLGGPRVVAHSSVHHREALVRATVRAGATRAQVLASMLPSGSVTGAPKVRAMEVIADLEASRRGLYTGGLGWVTPAGTVQLSMAIRTAVFAGDHGEYWAGGGIVEGSDPRREVTETRWKSAALARLAAAGSR